MSVCVDTPRCDPEQKHSVWQHASSGLSVSQGAWVRRWHDACVKVFVFFCLLYYFTITESTVDNLQRLVLFLQTLDRRHLTKMLHKVCASDQNKCIRFALY